MKTFDLEKVYALDEDAVDLPKHSIIGRDKNGDWFLLENYELCKGLDIEKLAVRKDFADGLLLGIYQENKPVPFFRDYWSFICNDEHLKEDYFNEIIVKVKKTQILGIMEELA